MKFIWWRILLAGIFLQFIYGIFIVVILGDSKEAFSILGYVSIVVLMMAGGAWISIKAETKKFFQASLVGVVAIIFYSFLASMSVLNAEMTLSEFFQRQTQFQYLLHDLLKIISALLGAVVTTKFAKVEGISK